MTKPKSPEDKILYTYRGAGRSPLGIPDRSLTTDEFERLSFLQQQWVRDSDTYVPTGADEPPTDPPKGGKDA